MYVFGLEMILIDKRIEQTDPSGRINEDKNSIKKDKQSIMIFKINMFGLPSTFQKRNMSVMSLYVFFGLKMIDRSSDYVDLEDIVKKNIPQRRTNNAS